MLKTLSKTGKPISREMGLGSLSTYTVEEVRDQARELRKLLHQGLDPLAQRQNGALATAASVRSDGPVTFAQFMEVTIDTLRPTWKSKKTEEAFRNTLTTYALPTLGSLLPKHVTTSHVRSVLEPIWKTKTITATRVRQRIEAVLDTARAAQDRHDPNPARWDGHLERLLTSPAALNEVLNKPALHYSQIPEFMPLVRQANGLAPRGLEFLILTAARTEETMGAPLTEIDWEARTWTIPAKRMKAAQDHIVPLSDRALEILKQMHPNGSTRPSDLIFTNRSGDKLSNAAFAMVVKRINHDKRFLDRRSQKPITPHGFRSTFSTWVAAQTQYDVSVREFALAHAVEKGVAGVYQDDTLVDKRRPLMADWAAYCAS